MPKPQETTRTDRNHIKIDLPLDMEQVESSIAALYGQAKRELHCCHYDIDKAIAAGRKLAGVGVMP